MASKNRPKKIVIDLAELSKKASPGVTINLGIKQDQLHVMCCFYQMGPPQAPAARSSRSRPKG
jgi:hypothetical protein